MIAEYPDSAEITIDMRPILHPKFQALADGLSEFTFASILPEKYETINRQQDLGDSGLRHAKMSYRPVDFVRKYRVKSC